MADVAEADADAESGEGAEGAPKKWNGKRIVLFVVLPLLLFVLAGGAVFFVAGLDQKHDADDEAAGEEATAAVETMPVFFELPEMLVNLNANGRRSSFLKIKVALELKNEPDMAVVQQQMPRVVDQFQIYLRELRAEDLRGSAGMQNLREEMLTRVRAAVEPVEVSDVLFTEMLVQ